jgi:hypothetical protein
MGMTMAVTVVIFLSICALKRHNFLS